jgi:Lon protease-like protein
MDLPDVLPLFPLPGVVHFPGVPLPLHVFEPRYRDLVRDALAGPRLVGMVLLRAGWEGHYYERPPVFAVGTAGEIVRADPLPDGRWNIVLRGLREFTIEGEEAGATSYRVARVRWRPESPAAPASETLARIWNLAREYLALIKSSARLPAAPAADTDPILVVNFFAQQLDLPAVERQALLEAPDPRSRGTRLATALAFQIEALRGGGPGSQTLQ